MHASPIRQEAFATTGTDQFIVWCSPESEDGRSCPEEHYAVLRCSASSTSCSSFASKLIGCIVGVGFYFSQFSFLVLFILQTLVARQCACVAVSP